jgi:phosphoglycolate phosphatase
MRASSWPRAVVFDLDGTLVDSAPDIAEALNLARATIGGAPFPVERVHEFIGGGSALTIRRALLADGMALTEDAERALLQRFMTHYERISAEGRGLYPGALELLGGLSGDGVALGLCTNKPEPVTRIALDALGITRYFGSVVGAREEVPKKPDPAMLTLVLTQLGIQAGDAVMIGDSAADVGVARAAGIPVLISASGYTKTPPSELGADGIYETLAEIPALMSALARG